MKHIHLHTEGLEAPTLSHRIVLAFICAALLWCTTCYDPGRAQAQADRGPGQWYTVQSGDTWYSLSREFGISVRDLQAANPGHIHLFRWLFVGHRLWIPGAGGATCPSDFAGYSTAIASQLNDGTSLSDLQTWLTGCGVITSDLGVVAQYALDDVFENDVVVVIHDTSVSVFPVGKLLVYHGGSGGYGLVHEVDGDGTIALLAVDDLNRNGGRNLVWTNTYCGAHTCVSELKVEQWDGNAYTDWIYGHPTMETATYTIDDVFPSTPGREVVVHGGAIGSVGAGPIRQRTETFASFAGGPYQLSGTEYDPTTCYYHRLVAENRMYDLANAPESGGYPIAQYEALLADASLTLDDCPYSYGPEMLGLLQDFTRFRLVVSYSAYNDPANAAAARAAITTPAIQGAADAFLTAYGSTPDVDAACAAVTTYAEANPASWEYMADWGYANPPFYAEWLCAGSTALTGVIWNDFCPVTGMFANPNASCKAGLQEANGIWEAGEEGLADVTVELYEGDCTTLADFPIRTATTASGGAYYFDLLTSGTYCVVVDAGANGNSAILIPGEWTAPAGDGSGIAQIPVTLTPGAFFFLGADFGWDYQLD
ncbi:MAG TPA: LysM peptidoglycan-binding domain-containing protein [Caldilineaceae bacterium]|nr:LysM peptidoglycan-binding domain-containing protein [Caldilineaceae bacterium]